MIHSAEMESELYYKQFGNPNIGFKRWTFHFCADTQQGFKVPLGMHKDVLDCRHLGITGYGEINLFTSTPPRTLSTNLSFHTI